MGPPPQRNLNPAPSPENSGAMDGATADGADTPGQLTESPPPVPLPPGPHLEIEELQSRPTRALKVLAKEYDVEQAQTLKKHELICEIIKRNAAKNGTANGGGVLDLSPEGYGFLRAAPLQLPDLSRGYLRLALAGETLQFAQGRAALRPGPRTAG